MINKEEKVRVCLSENRIRGRRRNVGVEWV